MMIVQKKEELQIIIENAKKQGKSVLIKKGVFDIIHPGHIFAIDQYKKTADIVIILIQSDSFTNQKKGASRPINEQKQRALVVDGIKGVDYVYLDTSSSREEYLDLLRFLKPSFVAVVGIDEQKTRAYGNEDWELKEFPDKTGPGYSTTEIIDRVLRKCQIG